MVGVVFVTATNSSGLHTTEAFQKDEDLRLGYGLPGESRRRRPGGTNGPGDVRDGHKQWDESSGRNHERL